MGRAPGQTVATPVLYRDTWNTIMLLEKASGKGCQNPQVVNTEITEPPKDVVLEGNIFMKGRSVERWTLDRCGESVPYRVEYNADGKGGTYINVRPEK